MKKKNKKVLIRAIITDIIAAIFFGLAIDVFVINANFATGGVTGLAIIINYLFKMPIGLSIILLNVPIILLTYKKLGKKFFLTSFKSIIICSFFVDYVLIYLPPFTGNRVIATLVAAVFTGIAYALLFNENSSSGGTDFIIVTLKKSNRKLSFGLLIFFIDGLIILLSAFVFKEREAFLYGLLFVLINSITVDVTTNILKKCKKKIHYN